MKKSPKSKKKEPKKLTVAAEKKDEKSLFLRIDEDLKTLIGKYGTDKHVVERLLESFRDLSHEDRRALVEGSRTLDSVGRLLAVESWSNHSFSRNHWSASAKLYSLLSKMVNNNAQHQEFASYRIAYALSEFALSLRVAGLRAIVKNVPPKPYFSAALKWTKESIKHSKLAEPSVGAPATFNVACGYSTLAQLTVERVLHGEWAEQLLAESSQPVTMDECTWKTIGKEWRTKMQSSASRKKLFRDYVPVEDVDEWAEKAIAALYGMNDLKREQNEQDDTTRHLPGPDVDYFRRWSAGDMDLMFLNCDAEHRMALEEWRTERGGTSNDQWLLEEAEQLQAFLPKVAVDV